MATEADVPESISLTTEGEEGYLAAGKFDITVDRCSPVQLKKSEGEEDQHPEPEKCFVEGEIGPVESKNGISECGNPLELLSDSRVEKQESCISETRQGDESNQAEREIPDRENGEKGSEEKEVVEAREEKDEQHAERNGIVNAEAAEASKSKTNLHERVEAISDQQDSADEIPPEKSFALVYEEKGPEVTSETKESAEDKLESASVSDDHEEKAGLEMEIQEKNIPDTPLPKQTEDIIEESPEEVKNQYETLEETPEASGTASEAVEDDQNAECQVESPCKKHEEDTLKKGEALDIGEASVSKEEDSEGLSAVEHSKTYSTDHKGESETSLKDFLLARPNSNSEEEAATSRESSKTVTTAEDERQVVNLEQSCEEEGKAEKVNTSSDTFEDETPDEQNLPAASILMRVVTESEIPEVGESTISEPNENVERCEEVLDVSTVKCDEDDQGDGTNPAKDDKDVDTFTAKVAEDEDYTSAVTIIETSAKVTPTDEESSPQTLQKCDSGEELQHSRDVMPDETKIETSWENAEEITSTKEETTIQSTQESLDEEKKEATENTNNLEDDNAREEACIEAADLSTNTEEKNLEEQAILDLSSPLVVEETAKEIPKEEETDVLILKEEKKEEDAECNEPTEVTSMTHETQSETTEDITEPNKDLNAPLSGESNKTFVENISSLAEVSETETEKNIREKDGLAVSNSDSLSGEVRHVTGLKEAETENEEQKENIDAAPEEKGQATILKDGMASKVEDIGVQAEESCESEETLEEHIPTAADEGETFSKEAEAEKEEQKKYSDTAAEEKGANICTDETPLEDTDVQAKKNVEPIENLEEQIPIRADEGQTFLKEAEAESKNEIKNTDVSHEDIDGQGEEVVKSVENLDKQIPKGDRETSLKDDEAEKEEQGIITDIVPEEKGPATILTDETSLDVEDIEVKGKDYVESKEKVEEQIPIAADEDDKSAYISLEDIDVQAEENFITRENLENPILTTPAEQETGSEETEAEIKAQVKSIHIVPEEKGLETISTAETPLVTEDIGVKAEESFKSKGNVEEQIPTAADEGEKFLKVAEAENKEQIDEENLNLQESSDKEKEKVTEITNTIEDDTEREEVLETTSTEQETGEHLVREIHTVAEPPRDSVDKGTNEENSAEDQARTEAADLSTTAEEKNLEEHAIRELSSTLVVEAATNEIPKEEETYALQEEEEKEGHATCNEPTEEYEAEIEKNIQEKDDAAVRNFESVSEELSHVTVVKESETAIEMQDKNIDTAPEEKDQATILADETASEVEDTDVKLKENFESKENLKEQFPIAAGEGEIFSKEAEAENKDQIKNVDIAHEDDVQAEKTINSEESIDKQILPIADEGETSLKEAEAENKEQVTYADIVPEEKGLATILTDETPLEAEDIGVQAEESFESKEKFEEKNPIAADEDETFLKEAEAENKGQIKYSDIAPEDKGLANILTDEKALNIEDIGLQAEETFNSSDNLESKIPSKADEHETRLKEAEAVNTEQVKYTDIVPEEKGLANILTDERSFDVEDTDVKADENFKSEENVEEHIPTTPHEGATFLDEAEAENKEHIKNTDISPEEKGIATISTDEATLDVKDICVQAERSFESKDEFEEKIPTAADEDETFLKEAEAEIKEPVKCSEIAPEEKGLANILTAETSLDVKDIEVKAEESFESNENLEEQILTAAGEVETRLRKAEAETDDQVKNDIAPEEKVLETISKDEMALDIDDACVQAEANCDTKELSDEQIPTAADEGEEKIARGNVVLNDTPRMQILEEAEPKVGVEEESCKSEDQPEKTNTTVEEDFDERKITGRDFNKEEIVEGNVACFTQESIEEDTVNKSQENENENISFKDEGSCIKSLKEANGDDLSPEYIREDESEMFKDVEKDAVKSGGEILEESQTDGVDESITCETNTTAKRSEEIVKTSPVKYEEGEHGESSSPASKEEDSDEDTFSIKVAEGSDGDNGAVTVIETSANANGEEGLPQAVQKYEPVEGHEKLVDVMPEESKTESSSENAEVVTRTKEETKIQNIQESSDEEKKEETTPLNDTKENETEVEEVFEIASVEQETGEHGMREIHTVEDNAQEFNDKETTEENLNEYQVSSEAADSSREIVGQNSDEQASRELSSSLVGEDTSNESSKQEENYVSSLKEEENKANVECKEPVEVASTTHETKFEKLEDSIEPKQDLYAPISEKETPTEESSKILVNSLQSDASEKDGCTDLKGSEAETKGQVKDIEIDHEEKGLATILTDGAALENVYSEEFSENQVPAVADEGEYNTALAGDKAAEESFQVQSLEEAEPKLKVEDTSRESEDHSENSNMIVEEPQLLEQVLDEHKGTDGDFSEGQATERDATICTPEIIQEETAKNSQDSDKETKNLKEEGSSFASVKACNTNELSREFIPEDGSKKLDDNEQDTVKFEGEILKEPEIAGVGESTTYETNQIAETSEEIFDASPVKYEEGQPGEGRSQDSAKASKREDVTEGDDNNGAVTVTELSAEVTSKGEEDSAQDSEKYEPEEEKVPVKISDVADVKEVCDLGDKASFAEKTTGETSLQKEGHAEVSELAPEKLDVDATEEEFKEASEIVPESDSRSIDVVSKDEIVTSQILDKGILQEQVEIPSSTMLTEEKEIEASQYEHEAPTKDKNIEEEHKKEVPADENGGDLSAVRSEDETPLQKEESEELKASELALEKLDAGDTEEPIEENLKTISKSDSQSTDAVLKDEIVADKTYLEASYASLPKEEELKTYQDDPETTTQDKSIEEEYAKETEVPADEIERDLVAATLAEETLLQKEEPGELKVSELAPADENVGDLSAVRSEDETPLQKEESEELKTSELALENLDSGDKEEIEESFNTICKSDSQSTEAVSKDEVVADKTHLEASYAPLSKEEELKTYQDDRETTTQDKSIEEEYAKETEVPAGENGRDLAAAMFAEETLLQKELKFSELAPENLDAGETEEEIKESFEKVSKSDSQSAEVVAGDEKTAYQTLHEGTSNEQFHLPSSMLLVEEKTIKICQREHETTTQDKNKEDESTEKYEVPADENTKDLFVAATSEEEARLQKEEPRDFKASELAPEKLDAGETEEEIKETLETISKSDSQCIDKVSKDDIVADQTLVGASYTSLPQEKKLKAGENEVPADEYGGDLISARSVEETISQKEEPGELKVSELAPEELNAGETEEEIKKTPETVSKPDSPSTDVVLRDEAISDQTLRKGIPTEKLQIPSSILLPEEKEIKASEEHGTTICDKNIEENASNLQMQDGENAKATRTVEETSLIKEKLKQLKASDFELHLSEQVPRESSNEEITEDEKLPEESEPYSVREESHHENKAKAEKQGEQIDETFMIKTNEHQNELSEVDEKGIASDKYKRQLTFEDLSIKENDPRFMEDEATQDGFPEEEKRVEEAAFEFGLKIQGDEINSKNSITATQMEKDSSTEKFPEDTISFPNLVPELTKENATKEAATACKELQTEEDEEEEHENSEQVKTDEEKGENEHKNGEPGYESPIMVEASRDADVNVKVFSHKKSNNILSGIKHSMSKVKKAIIGKSSHPKTHSEK